MIKSRRRTWIAVGVASLLVVGFASTAAVFARENPGQLEGDELAASLVLTKYLCLFAGTHDRQLDQHRR